MLTAYPLPAPAGVGFQHLPFRDLSQTRTVSSSRCPEDAGGLMDSCCPEPPSPQTIGFGVPADPTEATKAFLVETHPTGSAVPERERVCLRFYL